MVNKLIMMQSLMLSYGRKIFLMISAGGNVIKLSCFAMGALAK
jgi:hypothetical protein